MFGISESVNKVTKAFGKIADALPYVVVGGAVVFMGVLMMRVKRL
jgi:hypothetical protein